MASGNADSNSNIPQWKRDLIQRRRQQQNKVNIHNGVTVSASCISSSVSLSTIDSQSLINSSDNNQSNDTTTTITRKLLNTRDDNDGTQVTAIEFTREPTSGATVSDSKSTNGELLCGRGGGGATAALTTPTATIPTSVAFNMRLEADVSLCPTSEEPPKFTGKNNHLINNTEHSTTTHEQFDNDKSRNYNNTKKLQLKNINDDNREMSSLMIDNNKQQNDTCVFTELRKNNNKILLFDGNSKKLLGNGKLLDECESDSSEELQYGPGIVNKLKSKYLNLTLREMNKTRSSVQRFRRAASLEDLLDCNDDGGADDDDNADDTDKIQRKFMKKTMAAGVAAKTERYRNATRGNESIKRARSVETLMRYQMPIDDVKAFNSTMDKTLITTGIGLNKQLNDTNDDHIVLIDRTAVKIESRLSDCEQQLNQRPKALNKPKRLKPLLAETERPPTDLVKTTMKIFESSVKKLKPKGDVAIKVATFKTINDTFKAQAMKKCIPKPPIQPKPFVNGVAGKLTSPKKIVVMSTSKIVQEVIEKNDNNDDETRKKNDNVVTETIVQSVSSVVSKFQQIEKSQSPEPNLLHKFKYSPTPSPEPLQSTTLSSSTSSSLIVKQKAIVDVGNAKSPPLTPRTSSPLIVSPKKEIIRMNSCELNSISESNNDKCSSEVNNEMPMQMDKSSEKKSDSNLIDDNETKNELEVTQKIISEDDNDKELKIDIEMVDSPRSISKLALDNISKAGSSIKFNFNRDSCEKKNYLPGLKTNGDSTMRLLMTTTAVAAVSTAAAAAATNGIVDNNIPNIENDLLTDEKSQDNVNRINERLIVEKESELSMENDNLAISTSVELIKLSCHGNETKTQISVVKNTKLETAAMPQKQIGIIRPLVSTKTQQIAQQQNLSSRELEKNLINRVKSIEQPTKVVVSMKNADEIQPVVKKNCASGGGGGGGGGGSGGLWDTKPWNQQNNTMVFNFSNRKDVPDYIENDGLIIRRKREKPKAGDGGIIVLDATLDASTTDDSDWEISGGPPSPCDVSFLNDNILINGRSNLSKSPRNHKHRIQFDDTATRTFEYPSEASMLEGEGTSVDGETSASSIEHQLQPSQLSAIGNKTNVTNAPNPILGGGGLASFTPSKVDLVSEGFELGITRALTSTTSSTTTTEQPQPQDNHQKQKNQQMSQQLVSNDETDDNNTSKSSVQDTAAWGVEATADLLY